MIGMKSSVAGLAICAVAMAIAQPSLAEAGAGTRSYRVGDFDSVAAAGANLVIVHVGGGPAVTAEGPSATLDKMEVVVERGSLQIRPRREFRDHFDWSGLKRATFRVTAPRLNGAALAGSGEMQVDRADGDRFAASVAGSGKLNVAKLQVKRATLSMAGSGILTARGSAARADVSVNGSGIIHARGVASNTASVSISGSGVADLTTSDTASVSIVGSGNVDIAGRARCTVSRVGSGRVRCNS